MGILWDFTCKNGDVGEIFSQNKWWFFMGFVDNKTGDKKEDLSNINGNLI